MNTITPRLLAFCRFACLVAFITIGGCDQKQEGSVGAPAATTAQTRPATPPGEATRLQLAIEALRDLPYQHEPRRRPRVISERRPDRVNWLRAVLKRGYMTSGHTNTLWDSAANDALMSYVTYCRLAATDAAFNDMSNAVQSAVALGCDDSVVHYMRVRYGLTQTNVTNEAFALASVAAFREMFSSQYHPLLKFMAGLRATEAARSAEPKGKRDVLVSMVTACLEDIARDTNAPTEDVFETASMWVKHSNNNGWTVYVMSQLEGLLKENWGKEEKFFRLVGQTEIARAWHARGGDFAAKVTDQGWEDFRDHLNKAALSLETAWSMNPNNALTAYLMMTVELGQGQGRDRIEKWFHRAMEIAPDYYDAASLMGYYLEPRWYGSEKDAVDFGRSCVTSTNWSGTVPLVLANLHRSLDGYYKTIGAGTNHLTKPGVWEDVRASYERFFELNPSSYGYRHDYAKDAYYCGHYAEFLEQTKLFRYRTNFTFFGGEQQFNKMLQRASAAVAQPH